MRCIARRHAEDTMLLWLCQQVIASYHMERGQNSSLVGYQGIPIGNLTSQIFANIFLNELDRFVRHQIKPVAYLRYGDDFLLFSPTRRSAYQLQTAVTQFLSSQLLLFINPKNNIVVPANTGLHFLGHVVTARTRVVDVHTTKSVFTRFNAQNAASYRALSLSPESKTWLDWILAEKLLT